jgi:uncharacterized protein (TIGR03435 family)
MMRRTFVIFGCLAVVGLSFVLDPSRAQQPINHAVAAEKLPSFEAASIKPSNPDDRGLTLRMSVDRITIENFTLKELIAYAYDLKSDSQVLSGPDWLDKKHFDIAAKVDDTELAKLKTMSGNEIRNEWGQMMQSLLIDRFVLKVRRERRTVPAFALVVAKSGQKLTPAKAKETYSLSARNSHLSATAVSMAHLADFLTGQEETDDRVIVDRTDLTGDFDFKLDWTPDNGNGIPPDAQPPGLFTALRDQLGLQLKPDKATVDVLFVESAKVPEAD